MLLRKLIGCIVVGSLSALGHSGAWAQYLPPAAVGDYCSDGNTCPVGNKCSWMTGRCLPIGKIDCGTYWCEVGNKCSSGGCIAESAVDCGNGTHCDNGKCSRNGKMCLPNDAVDCGSHSCPAGFKCGSSNSCIEHDAVDCGQGRSCPSGKRCVNGGAECLTGAELAERAAAEKRRKDQAEAERKAALEASQQAARVAAQIESKFGSLITSPMTWNTGGPLYDLANTINRIRTYGEAGQLIPKLKQLGIDDPLTMIALQNQSAANEVSVDAHNLLYETAVSKAIDRLEQKGLVKDSNQWANRAVLNSIANTAFNLSAANLPNEIVRQTSQVVSQAMAPRAEPNSLVSAFVQQGAADIHAFQIARTLQSPQAERIRAAVASSIKMTTIIMEQLSNGPRAPMQVVTSNKWAIVVALINAKDAQLQGKDEDAQKTIVAAKQLTIELDKLSGTYNAVATPLNNQYQKFAHDVAHSQGYDLSDW